MDVDLQKEEEYKTRVTVRHKEAKIFGLGEIDGKI